MTVALEHKAVTTVREMTKAAFANQQAIAAAEAAASAVMQGLTITSDDDAAAWVDTVKTITLGERAAKVEIDQVLRIPKQMERAVKDHAAPVLMRLANAKTVLNVAQAGWARTKMQRAAEEERQQRLAAERATAAAKAQAEAMGDDVPPPPDVAPVVAEKQVRGGAGMVTMQVRSTALEVENVHECDPTWLQLRPAVAKAAFDEAVRRGEAAPLRADEQRVWRGVRFEGKMSTVNR